MNSATNFNFNNSSQSGCNEKVLINLEFRITKPEKQDQMSLI